MSGKRIVQPGATRLRWPDGLVRYYSKHYGKWITRKAPRKRGPMGARQQAAVDDFTQAHRNIRQIAGAEIAAAYEMAKGIPFLPRDLLIKAQYGLLWGFTDASGQVWQGVRKMFNDIQALLNSLGLIDGAVITRAAGVWRILEPGADGQVLTINSLTHLPEWLDPSGGGGSSNALVGIPVFDPSSGGSYATGYCKGVHLLMAQGTQITAVCFWAIGAVASAQVTPCLYDLSSGNPNALLATGPTITGVVDGINTLYLDAPFTLPSDAALGVGLTQQGAAVVFGKTYDEGDWYYATPGAPVDPAPSVTNVYGSRPAIWITQTPAP